MLPAGSFLATILTALLLANPSGACDNRFADDDGSIFEQDIARIAAANLTTGCNPPINENYCPNQPVTRAQMATFLNRALNLPEPVRLENAKPIRVVLGEVERLAADRGVAVVPISDGCRLGSLDRSNPAQTILAPPGELQFAYVTPEGAATDVSWVQTPVDGVIVVEQPWRKPPTQPPTPLIAAWQQNPEPATLRSQAEGAPLLDVVSPIWWYVADDGTISGNAIPQYVDDAHSMGKTIWPAIAGLDADRNHALLSDPVRREEAAHTISSEARAVGADGVNIDIEGFRDADADGFTALVAEVADKVHAWGGVVSFDLVPRTDTWAVIPADLAFWSTAPQRRELAAIVDYTILMSYDQFNRYRPGGPVAAPAWVEDTLVYQLRYSDPDQLLLGVPFYGRVWDPEDLDNPRALPIYRIEDLAEGGTARWDDTFGLSRVELENGRFLYLEDSAVIAERLGLVDEYGLGGWAAWRLGLDSPSLWDAIANRATGS